MFKKIFKKKENYQNSQILIPALLIHAAKIDGEYTDIEKKIIVKTIINLNKIEEKEAQNIFKLAEKKEEDSNQIIEFTKEIKNEEIKFRLKIIELLWKIIYSDNIADQYETNLMRRICGLLYIPDKDSGAIKLKMEKNK